MLESLHFFYRPACATKIISLLLTLNLCGSSASDKVSVWMVPQGPLVRRSPTELHRVIKEAVTPQRGEDRGQESSQVALSVRPGGNLLSGLPFFLQHLLLLGNSTFLRSKRRNFCLRKKTRFWFLVRRWEPSIFRKARRPQTAAKSLKEKKKRKNVTLADKKWQGQAEFISTPLKHLKLV